MLMYTRSNWRPFLLKIEKRRNKYKKNCGVKLDYGGRTSVEKITLTLALWWATVLELEHLGAVALLKFRETAQTRRTQSNTCTTSTTRTTKKQKKQHALTCITNNNIYYLSVRFVLLHFRICTTYINTK